MPDSKLSPVTLGLAAVALVSTTVAVTLWMTRTPSDARSRTSGRVDTGAAAIDPTSGSRIQTLGEREADRPKATTADRSQSTEVVINGRALTGDQVQELVAIYHAAPPKGKFWYDAKSGLYGVEGREAAGYIRPGHDFGPLSPRASNGDTGVFINGREINQEELAFLQILFNGEVQRGRAWLDGTTWNVGVEGNPIPIANLAVALQAAQRQARSGGSQWGWRDGSGAVAASDGNCTMMSVPGAPTYGTSGC